MKLNFFHFLKVFFFFFSKDLWKDFENPLSFAVLVFNNKKVLPFQLMKNTFQVIWTLNM